MSGLDFTQKCPTCQGAMAKGNKFCSLKCSDKTPEESIDNEPVRSWEKQ